MRRYIFLFAMLSLFVIGCSEESSVLAPVNNVNANEPNWIALPQAAGMHVNTEWTQSKTINGSIGGYLEAGTSYLNATDAKTSQLVNVKTSIVANIKFAAGAFIGKKIITMTLSDLNTSVQFGPSMVFNGSVVYNVTYSGIDLTGINPKTVQFAYLASDGSVQYAANDGIVVDLSTGTLQVINAKIPHFSRYGFVN